CEGHSDLLRYDQIAARYQHLIFSRAAQPCTDRGSLARRNEMIGGLGAFTARDVARPDCDDDRMSRDLSAFHLHGEADFAGLVLPDFDGEFAVGATLDAGD